MKDKKFLLNRAHFLVGGLGIEKAITLEELKGIVAKFVEEEIFLEPTTLPSSISGFTIRSKQGPFIVFYDQHRYGEARNLVIAHELAHLLQGDATNLMSTDFKMAIQMVIAGEESPNILCRSTFSQDPDAEKQVEFIATLLLQELVEENAYQTSEITLTGLKDL